MRWAVRPPGARESVDERRAERRLAGCSRLTEQATRVEAASAHACTRARPAFGQNRWHGRLQRRPKGVAEQGAPPTVGPGEAGPDRLQAGRNWVARGQRKGATYELGWGLARSTGATKDEKVVVWCGEGEREGER